MSRGISTVLDVGIAIVVVGAAVGILVGIPSPSSNQGGTAAPVDGAAIAGSTTTITYPRDGGGPAVVTGTAAGLLADAARARQDGTGAAYVDAITAAIDERIDDTGATTQLVAACTAGPSRRDHVVAGPAPPGGVAVDATTYHLDGNVSEGCRPVVVLRRWSP
ncbi:MAG: hypothetical protein ABEJ55_08990 [Halanaeroarchaeum sp.]